MVGRWRQLPLDHALSRMPLVQAAIQQLADLSADTQGRGRVPVPDLGPSVVMDQLTVVVYDLQSAGTAERLTDHPADGLPALLAELRRSL